MEGRLSVLLLATVLAVVPLLPSSTAQTTHVVGDSLGWTIPPGGPVAYTTWAANKTFTVGDILVFNFNNGAHDVAEVSKADFDACSSSNPLLLISTGPANITLNATGEHYYICTFNGHCGLGQKLQINVSAASASSPAPTPQPSTPSPVPAPQPSTITPVPAPQPSTIAPVPAPQGSSPTPSASPVTYTVGDSLGWVVPPGGPIAYQTWANNKSFAVGGILVFNYNSGAHDVAEVTKEAYQSCNSNNPISLASTPPTRITLTSPGEHFFICTFSGHCSLGQKLAINVTGSPIAPSPSPSSSTRPPSSTPPSAPSPAGTGATPPTPSNSATSLGLAGISATFLSLVVAFFIC